MCCTNVRDICHIRKRLMKQNYYESFDIWKAISTAAWSSNHLPSWPSTVMSTPIFQDCSPSKIKLTVVPFCLVPVLSSFLPESPFIGCLVCKQKKHVRPPNLSIWLCTMRQGTSYPSGIFFKNSLTFCIFLSIRQKFSLWYLRITRDASIWLAVISCALARNTSP